MAFVDDGSGTFFAPAALGGHTQIELDFIEGAASVRLAAMTLSEIRWQMQIIMVLRTITIIYYCSWQKAAILVKFYLIVVVCDRT